MRKTFLVSLTILLLAMTVLAAGALNVRPAAASADGPVFVPGNPSCVSLGYDYGFKIEPVVSGTYPVDSLGSVTIDVDDPYFDWSSTFGIDAVVVKGGPNANVFIYDPPAESFGGSALSAPTNPDNNKPYGLSHVEFCYDINLEVSKTAVTSFTRTFNWDIDKSVVPATWNLFNGDSGTSEYTVAVTKTGYTDSNWAVSGLITIYNPAPVAATITGVSDVISGGIPASVSCPVALPYELAAGGTLECSYSASLPDGSSRTNTATATTSGKVKGGTGSADVIFGSPTTLVNDTINVDDTYAGDLGSFSGSGSTSYTRTFTCGADEGKHDNIATIVETDQSDDASVMVNCYELAVTKDANTSKDRVWNWNIVKSADQTDLLLSEGQSFTVNYDVVVSASSMYNNWAVAGTIWVNNPAPIAATINSVTDVVSDGIAANVSCGVEFPYTLAANSTLGCTYTTALPDGSMRMNTAKAVQQNYSYDKNLFATPSGTTNYTGSAAVSFANAAVTEIDECIDVSDTNMGVLGTVCAGDAPKTFSYSLAFGTGADNDVVLVCGPNTHTNIADFVTNDTGTTGSDDHIVNANVACDYGCTLTPGYWKTHSEYGPARYDSTWALLPAGANTPFFLSGQTYYGALWTSPSGNAYYILAHAYIAAQLNLLNGASSTAEVDAAMTAATAIFQAYTPAQVAKFKGAARNNIITLATTLDNYNNGLIGPGHCSE